MSLLSAYKHTSADLRVQSSPIFCMFPTTVARSFVSVVFVCGQLIIIITTIIKRRLISRRNMPEDITRARKVESCPSVCRCGRERR